MKPKVRVKKAFNAPGYPGVYEVQGRRWYQMNWSVLRTYITAEIAVADAELIRRRGFTPEEKALMKGAG